ncbi:hypothetical protein K505DRAFT_373085 [Melanomma pulvis-pyrius CBS 109.77]|uniref:Uncharacterized protein n=1 Tax=Melanomma pulvis-pyrius CBS 109.77 TaxID=1314802 RepID=A0A6A6XJH7_9PLEO|nr:hypothetical protein K505DRAFT_373085 [Melanomma pulvis-pyrius CBS 109.77]
MGSDTVNPFTETSLLDLYRDPNKGKARYTWVHWARRVSASNSALESAHLRQMTDKDEEKSGKEHPHRGTVSHHHHFDTVTTLQLTHSLSPLRIMLALTTIFVLTIFAVLLWIFLGSVAFLDPAAHGTAAPPFPFLSLPAELLLYVYAHLCVDAASYVIPRTNGFPRRSHNKKPLHPAILRACRLLHSEAAPILYGTILFKVRAFRIELYVPELLAEIGRENAELIRRVFWILWDDLHMRGMMMNNHPVGQAEGWLRDFWFAPVIPVQRRREAEGWKRGLIGGVLCVPDATVGWESVI